FAERIQARFRLAAHPFRKRLKLLDLTADGGVPIGGKSVFGGGLPGPQKGLQTGQNGGEETDNTGAPLQIRGQLEHLFLLHEDRRSRAAGQNYRADSQLIMELPKTLSQLIIGALSSISAPVPVIQQL